MKKKLNIGKILNNDTVIRIMSVIVAVIVWLIVIITEYPNGLSLIKNIPINIDLTNTTPEAYNLSIIEGDNQTTNVNVEGKRLKIKSLLAEDFIAVPDLTDVTKPGEHTIRVDIKKLDERDDEFEITSESPEIKVKFDYLIDKEFPLEVSAESVTINEGYIKEQPFVNPETIMLTGPSSEILKVSKCIVSTDLESNVDDTTVTEGTLNFYDDKNNEIKFKHTEYEEIEYEITIPVNKLKTVPINFAFVNVPQGIDTSEIKYEMSQTEIEIAGPKNIIDEIKEISLGEIDYRMIDIGYVTDLEVKILAGIINVDNLNSVTVDFSNNELVSKQFTIPKVNILTRNIPLGYEVTLETKSINEVKIVGNEEDVEKLTAKDLIAYVDFNGKEVTEGSSRETVQIYISGNKFAWAVGEYRVVVNTVKKSS